MQLALRASVLFVFTVALALAFQFSATEAQAQSSYFTSQGCNGCHSAPVAVSCNGCHAHGTHPSSAKSSINVKGVTNKASYAPGETVTVTITGGYRTGWFRATLFDQDGVTELARSTGNDSGMGSSATYPATLTAPAPLTAGSYTWKVAWYGNQYDTGTYGTGWTPDPGNPEHGWEIVAMTPFTVTAATAAPTISAVTPNSLAQGAASQTVTITGANLTGASVSFSNAGVTHGTATVTAASISMPVSVTAVATVGAGTVIVTTAGGTVSSAFSVTAAQTPAPTISAVTPNSLVQGASSQTVTISGANLTGATVSFSNAGVTHGTATVTAASISMPVSVTAVATVGAGTVIVTTAGGTVSSAFSVTAAQTGALTVNAAALPSGLLSTPYSKALTATGGVPPYTWGGILYGLLPYGLTLGGSTGLISGTPTQTGVYSFTVWVTDNGGSYTTQAFDITVTNAACSNASVRIPGPTATYYPDFPAAYAAAADGSTIQFQNFIFSSDFLLDRSISVTLDGGYDCGYATKTGATGILGKLRVLNGTAHVGNMQL